MPGVQWSYSVSAPLALTLIWEWKPAHSCLEGSTALLSPCFYILWCSIFFSSHVFFSPLQGRELMPEELDGRMFNYDTNTPSISWTALSVPSPLRQLLVLVTVEKLCVTRSITRTQILLLWGVVLPAPLQITCLCLNHPFCSLQNLDSVSLLVVLLSSVCVSVRASGSLQGIWLWCRRIHPLQRHCRLHEDHGLHADRDGAHRDHPANQDEMCVFTCVSVCVSSCASYNLCQLVPTYGLARSGHF